MTDKSNTSEEDQDQEQDQNQDQGQGQGQGQSKHLSDEDRAKMLVRVVCICKGINLGRVLKGMEGCQSVLDVHRKVGTGSGGCRGERCSPRIKILLKKKGQLKDP